jgi:hypothetical protein
MMLVTYDAIIKLKIRIMKKQSITIIRKGIYSSFLTASLLFASLNYCNATAGKDPIKKADVQYLGKSDKYLAFTVNYDNTSQKNFVVELLDKDSRDVLYRKEYKDSAFTKNIYLAVDDKKCAVTFRIKSGKEIYEQSYTINTEVTFIDNLLVTKL